MDSFDALFAMAMVAVAVDGWSEGGGKGGVMNESSDTKKKWTDSDFE